MAIILYDLCGRDPALRFSPYCWRAKMALAHKGLAFQAVPTPFEGISRLENGVSRTVPIINDGSRIVADSFDIALYLDANYPARRTLFCGPPGIASAHFLQAWAFGALHSVITRMILTRIHGALGEADQAYFRATREARFECRLEEYASGIEHNKQAFTAALEPVRRTLSHHRWLAGADPAFADYIVFGTLMWLRTIAGLLPLPDHDPVSLWFERCLDLHGGLARSAAVLPAG